MTCPNCDGPLEPSTYNLHPHVAPWTCHACKHAWWNLQLTPGVRALWRREYQDYGVGSDQEFIHVGMAGERKSATFRGVNIRHDQLPLVHDDHLQEILSNELEEGFKAKVHAEVSVRANAST